MVFSLYCARVWLSPLRPPPAFPYSRLLNARLASTRQESLYAILDIPVTATKKEIKTAFYKKSLQFHPDRAATLEDADKELQTARFHRINDAYHTLSDVIRRTDYDRSLSVNHSSTQTQTSGNPLHRRTRQTASRKHDPHFQYYARQATATSFSGFGFDFEKQRSQRIYDFNEHYDAHYGREQKAREEVNKRSQKDMDLNTAKSFVESPIQAKEWRRFVGFWWLFFGSMVTVVFSAQNLGGSSSVASPIVSYPEIAVKPSVTSTAPVQPSSEHLIQE